MRNVASGLSRSCGGFSKKLLSGFRRLKSIARVRVFDLLRNEKERGTY